MDEEILGSVLRGIKPKDYTPIQVRPTPEFGGIQLTEEQQAKKDNMESVKDGEILPLGGFTDTVEAQWESAKDLVKSTDVYKNLFGNSAPDDNRLEQSEKLGSALGIAPQLIASDSDMYKAAVTTYERQRNAAALNNQPFSAKTLNELYPELDTEDTVATTIALKDYTNILKSREAAAQGAAVYTMPESKLTDLSNVIGYLYDTGTHFVGTAYEAGQALDAQSELMYKASIGEISDEEVEKAIPGLMNAQKAYNAEIGDSYVAKIVGETISQLSMQKNMIMRGAAEIIAPIAPLAQPILAATKTNLPQIATLGAASAASAVGATGAVAGAAVTGAAALAGLIALGTASVFTGTYRAEAGQAYWDWRTKKDKNGKSVYTREQAIGHAKRVGRINAAIETGAWELALKGITKVWGSDAAKAVIKNEAAMKKLIGAGRAAVGAKAIGYGAKQFAKVAAPEIAEEGLQSLSADIDTNLFGKETVPVREMMGNALDAMIEAVPSVVGMSIGGAALAGAGAHRAMKRITGLSEMKDAVIEFKRENERSMLQKLMDLRSESSLYKKAPETYRKTLQNQLDHIGSGTLYIDASAAAENEKTHDALNKLVEDGTITAKELDDAIKTGKPLEVETGKYMQTATPETHEALSDYTTMDKGEKTIHAIREERQRMKDMIDIVTMTREKREAAATEKILNDHFSDDTDIGREDRDTAREILSGGLDHIEDTRKTILQEAKDAWGKLTGVKELQDYMERRKTQDANFSNEKGVDMFDVGEGEDRVHLRVSKNPDWYQDFYGAYGRAPNQRELYDIAQEKIIAENDKGDEESKVAIAEIEEAKKRVESIERVSETLKSLNKEDLIAQTLLDPETYEEVYKPLLEEIKAVGNGAVTKAARDSALVLAKIAENFHKSYGVPLKLAMVKAGEVVGIREGAYGMAAFDVSRSGISSVSQFMDRIKAGKAAGEKPNKIRYTGKFGVSYSEEQVSHATILHRGHVLTKEQMDDIENHLDVLHNPALSSRGDALSGRYHGKSVLCRIDGDLGSYYVVLEVSNDNGVVWFKTGMAGGKESIDKIIAENSAGSLSYKDAGTTSQNNSAITIDSLPNALGIVKKDAYHQMAGEYAHNVLSSKSTKKGMAEQQLDADEKSFADSVDRFIAGKEKSPMVRVMTTPLVLKLTGAEVLPVEIAKTDNASKEIKDYLRAQGVTIRLYDPRIEGDRERVTNSAQDRVKQYFQEGSNYQGSYDRNANVIELFDGANESTVIHEGAHMFLSMLENMSQMSEENVDTYFNGDTAKARAALKSMQSDLSTIRSWAAFSEDHLSEYKGTILEKEFTRYAEDIRAGKTGAMERWMQERFARGFEKYLMDGSAPTKEMQGVFRRFKKWLTDIYKTAKSLGNVELTPEIKDIFDRMISTEAEINAWAAQRKLEAIDKTVNVNQSELGNLKAWAESVKDKALEKAMSYYLHMVREEAIENFTASISSEEERTSFIESLGEENEIYQIETIYNSDTFPTKKDRDEFLQMAGLTEKDLKEKLRAAGGTTEERWNKHIEEMVQHYREEALTPEAIRGMAEEILRSPEGMAKKSRIEAMLLEKKVSAYIHLVNSMQMELKRSKDKKKTAREIRKRLGLVSEKETTEVDKQTDVIAKSEDKIAKLEKQKKLLKEQLEKAKAEAAAAKGENQSRKESQTILEGNMRALEAELEKERAQRAKADSTTKDAELTAADLAVQLQTMVDGLKESRDAMRFDMREIKQDARNTLGGEKLSHATSWRWWENKAQIAEARAMKAAAGNDWEGAAYWKREQAQCLTMSKFARANEEEIRRTLHGGGGKVTTPLLNENGMERYGILGILNRISRTDKPVMMKDDARYFVQHMAYVLGLTKKDGILPIDESGQERPFNWRWLAVEMNPMQAMDDDRYMAEDIIPGWMRSAFDGSSPMKLKDITMDQFREMAKVMKAVYKLGRREYEGNTLGTSFDDAAQKIHDEIIDNWTHRVATPGLKNQTATNLDRLGTKIHSLIKDITLPEILIERLGKSAAEYFYKPMDKAAAHLRELKSAARVTFRKNFAIYSRKEWTAIRSKKLYTIGLDERGKPVSYTKEQLLAMALNFGTKSNRTRLIETLWLSDTLNTDEKTILDMLDKNLTDKDWDFVESVWEHLNSYWGERNKVQNDLYGTPLGKVQGEDFTLKSGRVIHGAYYRIKYDPLSSTKTSNFSTTDIAKMDMQNISSFSLGMGSTKQRAGASGGQKLRLDLDVYVEAVNEAMQHIAMREATVDVYKLLNRKEVVTAIENTAGPETLSLLQGWAKDCWHSSIKDMSEWDSTLGRARRRFNFTTMGFRFSTALLNIGNITGMMERMGAANAIKAVGDFYFHGNIVEQRRFIQAKSTMMRDRGATIDRDMYMQDRLPVGKNESEFRSKIEHGKYGVDTLNSKAYWLIQATDEMFSLPEWLFTYKRAMAAMEIEGKLNRDEMDAEAVRLADKAVRETFGSNETKDQTGFIRKNGILAQMTTFYSYTNLVTNQFIRAGYVLYDKGDVKPLLAATWYWWILGALVETALREIGDDSDDEDKWKKKFLHVIASGGPIGGVPIAREAVPWTVDFFTGKSFGSAAPDAPFFDTLKHMEKFLKATKKGDLIEMGRGATKVITRTSIPVPDTITDAFWNFMRMVCTDTEFTMWDWFRKSLWDKTLKEKKK